MTRKLDVLVAERVMRWRRVVVLPEINRWMVSDSQWSGYYVFDWSPSTDITDAWQVVEKMRQDLWLVNISGGHFWDCEIIDMSIEDEDRGDYAARNKETAPLAICIAALRAVGVDEAEIQAALE